MVATVASFLLDSLAEAGVTHIFGLPGDSVDTLLDPIRRHPRLRFVQVRHEEAGAFMASAQAKLTGRPSVALGTSGPGAIHLLNGLYDAKLDAAPVIALTGQVATPRIGTGYFQEVDLERLFGDVAVYNQRLTTPAQAAHIIPRAIHEAVAQRGVAHLTLPFDLPPEPIPGAPNPEPPPPSPAYLPTAEALLAAADVLNRGERVAILAGRGTAAASAELSAVAERLQAPVIHSLPAKGVLPDRHPHLMGGLGLLGAAPAHSAMETCDTLLLLGSAYPYLEFLPNGARVVQIDRDPAAIGRRMRTTAALVGHMAPTLRALLPLLRPQRTTAWFRHLQAERQTWLAHTEGESRRASTPLAPPFVAGTLSRLTPPDAVVAVDVGNVLVWMVRHFEARGQRFLVSSWLGSMGFALPAAVAAKLSHPERPVLAVAGDGGFAMLMPDFLTAVKYRLPLTVVVLNNQKLAMIKYEQEVEGLPEWGVDLLNPDFARFADICGGRGFTVARPEELAPALTEAMASDRPALVDVKTEANYPPMPPRVTFDQAKNVAVARLREAFVP